MISSHYKNEFDSRGQLFSRFLSYSQFGVTLSFFVLSVKCLFVEDWDFFLLNSGLMILSALAAFRGLTSFKLKDYMTMRNDFFQSHGLVEHHLDFANEDDIFRQNHMEPRMEDPFDNAQLQRSVIRKFHNLYTDSVLKEVILRSQAQFRQQNEQQSARGKSSEMRSSRSQRKPDSLAQILSDSNVNKLSKHYMNTCGLDISFGSVEGFDGPPVSTRRILANLIDID